MRLYHKKAVLNGLELTESNFITRTGYEVSYEIVDGGLGGLLQDNSYREDEIGLLATVTFSVMPLDEADMGLLLHKVYDSDLPLLIYYDPRINDYRTIVCRRGELSPAKFRGVSIDGHPYWTAGKLVLKENYPFEADREQISLLESGKFAVSRVENEQGGYTVTIG